MPTLAYRLIGGVAIGQDQKTGAVITSSQVVWDKEPVNITADAALAAANATAKKDDVQSEARKFLRELLSAGNPVPYNDIIEQAEELGFSSKQIKTASRKLGVIKNKIGFDASRWEWVLPTPPF